LSNEVVISADLLVDLFRVGNVLEDCVVDVTEGIPAEATLEGISVRPATNEIVLHLDRPSPTPTLRWRAVPQGGSIGHD
jgi:hypothetical protein